MVLTVKNRNAHMNIAMLEKNMASAIRMNNTDAIMGLRTYRYGPDTTSLAFSDQGANVALACV